MQRVLVIGPGGGGKSTFAKRLAERTGLPVLHLDAHFWRAGWIAPAKEEWNEIVARLAAGERWIMDGNYGGTMDVRLAACDTVIFLDMPRLLCLGRVIARRVRYRGRSRPDMAPGCEERLDLQFLQWIWTYPTRRRPAVLQRLSRLREDQQAVVLRSRKEVEEFLSRRDDRPPPRVAREMG